MIVVVNHPGIISRGIEMHEGWKPYMVQLVYLHKDQCY